MRPRRVEWRVRRAGVRGAGEAADLERLHPGEGAAAPEADVVVVVVVAGAPDHLDPPAAVADVVAAAVGGEPPGLRFRYAGSPERRSSDAGAAVAVDRESV